MSHLHPLPHPSGADKASHVFLSENVFFFSFSLKENANVPHIFFLDLPVKFVFVPLTTPLLVLCHESFLPRRAVLCLAAVVAGSFAEAQQDRRDSVSPRGLQTLATSAGVNYTKTPRRPLQPPAL